MHKIAVVTDFDGTLMEQDVGDEIMDLLDISKHAQVVEASRLFREKKIGSLAWIEAAYPLLNGRQKQVDSILEGVNLREGARDFVEFCLEKDTPVTVLSDGMQYYIEQILRREQLSVSRVIANPIHYTSDGEFQFGVQNTNAACKWCGCCKASIVKQLKEEGWLVIYIGDGSSDYYGSGFADWIFARGRLARYLTAEDTAYYPFDSFYDILQVFASNWESYVDGTAARRLCNRTPAACAF